VLACGRLRGGDPVCYRRRGAALALRDTETLLLTATGRLLSLTLFIVRDGMAPP